MTLFAYVQRLANVTKIAKFNLPSIYTPAVYKAYSKYSKSDYKDL